MITTNYYYDERIFGQPTQSRKFLRKTCIESLLLVVENHYHGAKTRRRTIIQEVRIPFFNFVFTVFFKNLFTWIHRAQKKLEKQQKKQEYKAKDAQQAQQKQAQQV